MHEVDHAVKVICGRHPNCFLNLFYGSDNKVKLVGVEDTQLQVPEHRADKIWRIHDSEQEGCLMLEAITEPDKRDFPGIILKNATVRVALKLPVLTVLVYVQRGKYRTFPEDFEEKLGGLANRFFFTRICLWEHKDRIISGELKELAPLLPLLYDDPKPEVLKAVNEIIETFDDEKERKELKGVAALIGARKFADDLIHQILKMEYPMVRETSIFKKWWDEARSEGWSESQHTLLLKQLDKKFGQLPDVLKKAIQNLSNSDSDALAVDLFDLQSIEDLKTWLEKINSTATLS